MDTKLYYSPFITSVFLISFLTACGGSGGGAFTIGGSVSGLSGTVVLQNNGGDDLSLTADGSFTFATSVSNANTYAVTVLTQPTDQNCTVTNGSGTVSSANVTDVTVSCNEAVAPTVNSTSPADGATGVAKNTTVTATFSEDMLGTSIDSTSFTIAGNSAVSGAVTFDGSTNIATFTPGSDLGLLTQYTATLTTDITDLVGNPLASDHMFSFTTADGSWGTAELMETDDSGNVQANDIPMQIGFDQDGNAHAVWSQFDGARNNIMTRRYIAGTGWETPVHVSSNNGIVQESNFVVTPSAPLNHALFPKLSVIPNGEAMAVWEETTNSSPGYVIFASHYSSSWSMPVIISDPTVQAANASIAMNESGNAVAVWEQHDGARYNTWANTYTAGSGWGTAELIETDNAGGTNFAQVAMDNSGNAIAVWNQFDGIRSSIWANRYTAGTGWGTAELIEIDNGAASLDTNSIAMDTSGNAIAVWSQFDGARDNIWANRYVVGSGWGTAELIETDNNGGGYEARIAFDSSGNAIAIWTQSAGGINDRNVWSNRYTAGTGWGTAELIETNDGGALEPFIDVDTNGHAMALWVQYDATNAYHHVWANRYVAGSGWGTAAEIGDNAGLATHPGIAIDNKGNAIALWVQRGVSSIHSLHTNRFE